MKKIILGVTLLLACICANAQSEKFIAAMKTNTAAIDAAMGNAEKLLSLSNNFERIGNAEKNQWLPFYYAALLQVNYAFMQKDMAGNDPIADKAASLLSKADSLSPKNSEISCIKSMISTVRMLVSPQQRYMTEGAATEAALETAKAEDATNPRPYYLKGENLKSTPAQFGGGCGPASEVLKIAKEKFATFKPANDMAPNWGLSRTEKLLDECK